MTLAVASIYEGNVHLFSDMQLTYPEALGKKPDFGMKIFFLDKHTAIAFSGSAGELAHSRLKAIQTQGYRGDIFILANQIKDSFDQEVDFLLAQTAPTMAVAKVSDGKVSHTTDGDLYWIGDGDVARYVAESTDNSPYALKSRLNDVLLERRFKTVGGNVVSVMGNDQGFKFVPTMCLTSPRYVPPINEIHTVDFGNAQNGGYGYTTVAPKERGINGWGIFYFQGRYGEYWNTDLESGLFECLGGYADNVYGFVELLQNDLGIEIDYCGSLG